MDDHDDDIEFDFFEDEEDATQEASSSRVRMPRRGARGPRRSIAPPRGSAPLLRLLALVVLVIFLVLMFGLLIQSCASASKYDAYAHYIDKVNTIAGQSTQDGKTLAKALTTPGLSVAAIDKKLHALADDEMQNVAAAQELNPPGPLRPENGHLIDALELRVSGLLGLADTFKTTAGASDAASSAALLAAQGQRLLASDVVWADFFSQLVTEELQRGGISGVAVPTSRFVASGEDLSARGMALVLQRISGASTGGSPAGTHGTDLVSVAALPNGTTGASQVLMAGSLITVTATTSLAFVVTIHNGGDAQEVQVPVTLTIDRSSAQGGPITKTQTLQLVDPGQQATVVFGDLGQVPFAQQVNIRVDVAPVPGEKNTANNSALYPVIFSLPAG